MKLNQVTSVPELFLKFMPHVNVSDVLKYEIANNEQSKKFDTICSLDTVPTRWILGFGAEF
jgi:hypothetical protein